MLAGWHYWTVADRGPRGVEFPLEGDDLNAVTRHYVNLLRET